MVLGQHALFGAQKLPPGEFELFFVEEKGFIFRMEDADGEVCPVSSLMKRQVLEDADGAHHIVWPGGEQISVKDLAHFRVLKTLGVKVVPSDVVATLSFAHFQWPRFGFRIFMNVTDIHKVFSFSQYHGKSSDWVNHRWKAWQHYLVLKWHVLPDQHMQKAKAYCQKAKGPTQQLLPDEWIRTLPFPAVSLHVLLIMLFDWSFRNAQNGGFSAESDQQKARCALQSVIGTIGDMQALLCREETQLFAFPRPRLCVGFKCLLQFSDGHLDLQPLRHRVQQFQCLSSHKILDMLSDVNMQHPFSLWAVLSCLGLQSKAISLSPHEHELIGQILRQCSDQLDQQIVDHTVTDMVFGQGDRMAVSSATGVSQEAHLQTMVQGHLQASKQAVFRSCADRNVRRSRCHE